MTELTTLLMKYNLTTGSFKEDQQYIPFRIFLSDKKLKDELLEISQIYHSKILVATASTFIKRFLIIRSLYELVSLHHIYMGFELDQLYLSIEQEIIHFHITSFNITQFDSSEKQHYLKQVTEFCFKTLVNPLIHSLSQVVSLNPKIYYDHVAFLIDYIYTNKKRSDLIDDHLFLKSLSPQIFYLKSNPLDITFVEEYIPELDKTIKIRKSCCLRYLINDHDACYTCPNIPTNQRILNYKKSIG